MTIRRTLPLALAALAWGLAGAHPAPAATYDLVIGEAPVHVTGHAVTATAINGTVPGPTLRWHEGEEVTIRVTNRLDRVTSLHWHGILLPYTMDGVPGVSYGGIAPGQTFVYRFTVGQSGTYWYHGHSGTQEQSGLYGPLVIVPKAAAPFAYDRDDVVMLSDWTDTDPERVMARLKKAPDYYNHHRRTVGDFLRDVRRDGLRAAVAERVAWGRMRMGPSDIADVTGATYTYLMNGHAPAANWTALYAPGDRVRLRLINGSSMTFFDVRVPGLAMTVVAADGQDVEPVTVDELRLGVAETYDVIVTPKDGAPYTVFAEAMDRSGYARGTLATREGESAPVPARRAPPERTMAGMKAAMPGMKMGGKAMPGMDKGRPPMPGMAPAPGGAGALGEPGLGLGGSGRRVLTYADLRALTPFYDTRPPGREIDLHLTGNMARYRWSFDGKKFSEAEPIRLTQGERVRVVMINDTMMEHPIHLHGMWMQLENGNGAYSPRKHTIIVRPGQRVSVLVTADAPGQWAFHCHLLYHMEAGMFRKVVVAPAGGAGGAGGAGA
jgi:FtsP/CotA-like multicopper oxidase with cupredoxin domain